MADEIDLSVPDLLAEVEALTIEDPLDEDSQRQLSIGAWSDRIRAAVGTAIQCARAGDTEGEKAAWLQAASHAVLRARVVQWYSSS